MEEDVVPVIPKRRFPLLPLIFGVVLVVMIVGVAAVVYYQTKLVSLPAPSPTSSAIALASADPSPSPSSSPSASPKSSPKASFKPVSVIPSLAPTPTPVPRPTLDIRFGNPSANVKQTIDQGTGDGRVINREYTSIQAGQFDEVSSSWSPRVTVCFHMVSNQEIKGSDLKFTFSLDDKVDVEDNLGQYDKLEAGRLYDWCHDVTTNIGHHTARLLLNGDKSLKESNYVNDVARLEWDNLKDNVAPNFTLMGPNNEGTSGTCLFPQYISDNVTAYVDLKIEQQIDSASWSTFSGTRYCFVGTKGSQHTYVLKITDARGNVNEQNKTFVLY